MNWHPDISMMLKYSSGHLSPALTIAVAIHQAQCSACRKMIRELEMAGGQFLEEHETVAVAENSLDMIFDKIDAGEPEGVLAVAENYAIASQDEKITNQLINGDFDQFDWEKVTRHISVSELDLGDPELKAELLKFGPNARIPKHTHNGMEYTLVLQGQYSDCSGDYHAGEFVGCDETTEHSPKAGPEGCVCLALTDAPLKFTGLLGPFINMAMKN